MDSNRRKRPPLLLRSLLKANFLKIVWKVDVKHRHEKRILITYKSRLLPYPSPIVNTYQGQDNKPVTTFVSNPEEALITHRWLYFGQNWHVSLSQAFVLPTTNNQHRKVVNQLQSKLRTIPCLLYNGRTSLGPMSHLVHYITHETGVN